MTWAKIIAGIVGIVSWFQEQFRISQIRQDERNEVNAETLKVVVKGKEAKDMVANNPEYAAALAHELGLDSVPDDRNHPGDDGLILSELRNRLSEARRSSGNKSWNITELLNIPTAVYRYSKSSLGKLETCHGELQIICLELSKTRDCTVVWGTRSLADQQKAYDSGASKMKPGKSKHNRNPSDAVDIVPAAAIKLWAQKKDLPASEYQQFAKEFLKIAKRYGIEIRWGGDWDRDGDSSDQTFMDFAHFERV